MKVKLLFNYILQFCVSILFFLLILIGIARFTIFNSNYMFNVLEKTNYYDKLYDEIQDEMENFIVQSGFDDDIAKDIFTKEQMHKDVDYIISNLYRNQSYEVDTSSIETKLEENIDSFLANHNITITDKSSIENFAKEIVNVYESKVNVFDKISFAGKIFSVGGQYLLAGLIILAAIILLIVILLKKVFHRRILPVMFFTGMFLLLASSIYFGNRLDLENINLYTTYVSALVSEVLKNFIAELKICGIVSGLLGLITILFQKLVVKKGRKE